MLVFVLAGLSHAETPVLQKAAEAELERTMNRLDLPDHPGPYFVSYEILDGDVATASAFFGALDSFDHEPYRNLRVEVRVGDYDFDSSNFAGGFGSRDGVQVRALPIDDVEVALRREIWLATDEAYKGATEQLSAKKSAREGDETEYPPDLMKVEPLVTEPRPEPKAQAEEMKRLVLALSDELGEVGLHLEEASAVARDWQGTRMLVTSEGTRAWLPTGFTVVRVQGTARTDDGARIRNGRSWVAKTPDLLPPLDVMKAEVRELGQWLEDARSAPVERDYLGPVLFEEPAAVELFRQLVAPEIAGTPPEQKGRDMFSDGQEPPTARVGRRLLPQSWTIVDDPTTDLDLAGAYEHDFEGVPARRVTLVEDGVVQDLLMSRVPRKDIGVPTGHGRSLGSARREALPAVVEIEPKRQVGDKKLRKKALRMAKQAGLDYVLVIRRLEPPAMTDDFHVAFTGEGPLPGLTPPYEAYRLYPDGREEVVRGLGFLGVDRRALRDIVLAGRLSDPVNVMDSSPGPRRFSIGAVGGLPSTWSAPPVLVSEMELRGTGATDPRVLEPPKRDDAVAGRP